MTADSQGVQGCEWLVRWARWAVGLLSVAAAARQVLLCAAGSVTRRSEVSSLLRGWCAQTQSCVGKLLALSAGASGETPRHAAGSSGVGPMRLWTGHG
jgi:hypothetical protein